MFCSKGDNITPPQQALGWILDLYGDVDDIRSYGQTIVYTVHETVGHLGIFVSGGVAKKEHSEFSSNIDLIDVLPPGLYEATFEAKSADTANPDLASGNWIMRCERRTLDDIRAMGGNTAEDERRFATAARVSEINLSNYRNFVQPWVRAAVPPQMAELMRQWHPLRVSYEAFGGDTVAMKGVARAADKIREQRKPAAEDNPFIKLQETASKNIVDVLDKWRDTQEAVTEALFLGIYGSPVVQAAVGITPDVEVSPKPQMSPEHRQHLDTRIAELKSQSAAAVSGNASFAACSMSEVRGEWSTSEVWRLCGGPAPTTQARVSRFRSSRRSCVSNSSCCCWSRKRASPPSPNCFRRAKTSGVPASRPSAACCLRVRKYPVKPPSGSIA